MLQTVINVCKALQGNVPENKPCRGGCGGGGGGAPRFMGFVDDSRWTMVPSPTKRKPRTAAFLRSAKDLWPIKDDAIETLRIDAGMSRSDFSAICRARCLSDVQTVIFASCGERSSQIDANQIVQMLESDGAFPALRSVDVRACRLTDEEVAFLERYVRSAECSRGIALRC